MAPGLRSLILSSAFILLFGAEKGLAQYSNVTCISSYSWAKNSKKQDPCVVASYLQSSCNNGDYTINTLPPGYHYIGPTQNNPSTQNYCICSTPVYELMSACGACQNQTFITWSAWSLYCTNFIPITEAVFNSSMIPGGTAIPQWAFQKPSDHNDSYSEVVSEELGDTPESTYVLPSGASKTTSRTSSRTSGSPTTSSTQTKGGGGGGGSSNTAAIAGGVAGGVVGLALIGAIAFLVLRKPSPKPAPLNGGSAPGAPIYAPVPTPQPQMTSIQGTNEWPTSPNTNTNPNPSTTYSREMPSFPTTDPHYADQGFAAHGAQLSPVGDQYQVHPGGYSGVPEI